MQIEMQASPSRTDDSSSDKAAVSEYVLPVAVGESFGRSATRRPSSLPSSLFRYQVIKRGADLAFVVVALPVLLPVLFVVAMVVKLTSPGPIFFSHRRIGKDGAFFSMWKFRTMCVNSADVLERHLAANPAARREWNECHKLRFDPRITSVGLFLRKYSLDELPQIWNVFRAQMSLIGPRPIVAAEVEKYADAYEDYCRVKPGLTGLWQVSGRSKLTYDERVALDRRYVASWSLFADLKILLSTFKSVVNRDGAY